MYKKVVKFSFTQQKIFWVLVFSFMYLVSVDPMDRSKGNKLLEFHHNMFRMYLFDYVSVISPYRYYDKSCQTVHI